MLDVAWFLITGMSHDTRAMEEENLLHVYVNRLLERTNKVKMDYYEIYHDYLVGVTITNLLILSVVGAVNESSKDTWVGRLVISCIASVEQHKYAIQRMLKLN